MDTCRVLANNALFFNFVTDESPAPSHDTTVGFLPCVNESQKSQTVTMSLTHHAFHIPNLNHHQSCRPPFTLCLKSLGRLSFILFLLPRTHLHGSLFSSPHSSRSRLRLPSFAASCLHTLTTPASYSTSPLGINSIDFLHCLHFLQIPLVSLASGLVQPREKVMFN